MDGDERVTVSHSPDQNKSNYSIVSIRAWSRGVSIAPALHRYAGNPQERVVSEWFRTPRGRKIIARKWGGFAWGVLVYW